MNIGEEYVEPGDQEIDEMKFSVVHIAHEYADKFHRLFNRYNWWILIVGSALLFGSIAYHGFMGNLGVWP